MNKLVGQANVYFNRDFFYIRTMSRGMLAYAEPEAEPCYLTPDASDDEIGKSVRQAFSVSKVLTPNDFNILYKSGVIQAAEDERNAWAREHFGYKSKRAMYLQMMCCWVSLFEERIEIQPTIHDSLDGYRGIKKGEVENLHLSADISDIELGAAIREGFRRCTSEWP